jgi:hypothetical protein
MKNMNNNDQYLFDDLIDDWQQYSSRIDQIVSNHPITVNQINHRAWRPSWHRRLLLSSSLRALVCLIAMVFLSFLFGSYVADIFDLIPLLLIGGMLLFVFVSSLRLVILLLRHPIATTPVTEMSRFVEKELPYLMQPVPSTLRRKKWTTSLFTPQFSRAVALASVVAIFLIVYTPAYDGRLMSAGNLSHRTMAIAKTNQVVDNLSNINAL